MIAVNDLSLTIEQGTIFGVIGPNGAGKTTTMRILTTLLAPTGGDARVGGYSVTREPDAVRHNAGHMPDSFGVYDDMKVGERLDFFAACHGVPAEKCPALARDLLGLMDLGASATATWRRCRAACSSACVSHARARSAAAYPGRTGLWPRPPRPRRAA